MYWKSGSTPPLTRLMQRILLSIQSLSSQRPLRQLPLPIMRPKSRSLRLSRQLSLPTLRLKSPSLRQSFKSPSPNNLGPSDLRLSNLQLSSLQLS